ncbi:iron chelate uptake ABC transporter family permease subunit, partial [Salinispora arenicola]|uniref:iron chelate uptake ABC transporter family permease subunit n=1 Tax=Salinispora arenicola TaxID=168697 RepID=UPI0027DB9DB4
RPRRISLDVVCARYRSRTRRRRRHRASSARTGAIVWGIRLPRVLLAPSRTGLALVGAVLQAVLRNPLADPYIIGVTSGASLGAVSVMLIGLAPVAAVSVPTGAFAARSLPSPPCWPSAVPVPSG